MNVQLFIPCFIDQFYPHTAESCMKLLELAGCHVQYNPDQTCCGQPAFNSGYWTEARKLAQKFIHDFQGDEVIVAPSASCTGYVKSYYTKLFENDKGLGQEAETLSGRLYELSDFLVNKLQFTSFNSMFSHSVTFHDSCSGLREYGIKEEPRTLLRKVNGLQLVEMKDTNTCCGFGGTFSAKFHHISTAMTEQKVENALESGAEYIVSTEASCLMNIDSYIRKQNLPIKTIHLADVLTSGI